VNKLWEPTKELIESSEMTRFQKYCDHSESTYSDFHKWSVDHSHEFWNKLTSFYDVSWKGDQSVVCSDDSFETYGWYPHMSLNFAENLLKKGNAEDIALNAIYESNTSKKITYKDLRTATGQFQNSLKDMSFGAGDVLACYMPNISETVISMLGVSSLGGIFTSTSADFGVGGVVDRFGQSKPRVLVTVSSYEYNGKKYSLIPRLKEIAQKLDCIEKIVIIDFLNHGEDISDVPNAVTWEDFLSKNASLEFKAMKFSEPLYIMYSSGTTGKPKCIVHSAGGTLLQHIKEHGLHSNVTQDKNLFYFTTCGWMMWNWLVSGLYFGGTITLYEGSPGYPSLGEFFEIIDREKINIFGTSPKFLKVLEDSGYVNKTGLNSLESILSTGAPLIEEQFDFIYNSIKKDVCVSSICGGTDIIGCFMLGNPNLSVHRGEIQCLGLGMDVAAVDSKGNALFDEEGELVCRKSFPSRPLSFLGDEDGEKIKDAYFNVYENFWHHGDFIKINSNGGVSVAGRSDATLNPGGVRIGTAEIYRQTEKVSWIEDSACVGRTVNGEVDVVLFVKLKAGEVLDDKRIKEVKMIIKENTTPRHVPKDVWEVSDIPYTRSGKKMELAITRILAGRELLNIEAVANPDCLNQYSEYLSATVL
jgi:acetoacetyl-CoA synthetase